MEAAYRQKLLPLEELYHFHHIHSPALTTADFHAKPMILFIGQYSTGKTSLIKFLLNSNFPGIRIGPEPTTDRFISIMYGPSDQVIPGSALVLDHNKQFGGLQQFGNKFLNRFQASISPQPVLNWLTFIDTPGIVAGERYQDREYDYPSVLKWFADRADRIILMLDAHKLDISDELQKAIHALHSNIEKMHVVLNKADLVDPYELIRVHGALMWSLSKNFNTPEVIRVYIGSFWNEPLRYEGYRKLFASETKELIQDIESLPRNAALRKINDLTKRARLAKAHALLINYFHNQFLGWWGLEKKRLKLIEELPVIMNELCIMNGLAPGDLPISSQVKGKLQSLELSSFIPLKPKLLAKVDEMLSQDISTLVESITKSINDKDPLQRIQGGVFQHFLTDNVRSEQGTETTSSETSLISTDPSLSSIDQTYYDQSEDLFISIQGSSTGKLSKNEARQELLHSQLPDHVLNHILNLADYDSDGYLNVKEFTIAFFLCSRRCEGFEMPNQLPESLKNFPIAKENDCELKELPFTIPQRNNLIPPQILPAFPPLENKKK